MASRTLSLDSFVDGLRAFESDYITRDRIAEYCSSHRVDPDSLAQHTAFRADRYSRSLIFRDPLFEVMLICWQPGQTTPVHSHNGQLGWMTVERGSVDVTNFRYVSCSAPQNQNVAGIDCIAGGNDVRIETLDRAVVTPSSDACTVDKGQTIHQIACPAESDEPALSLHIYSLPFESCVTYDPTKGTCGRRTLFWDMQYGKPVD